MKVSYKVNFIGYFHGGGMHMKLSSLLYTDKYFCRSLINLSATHLTHPRFIPRYYSIGQHNFLKVDVHAKNIAFFIASYDFPSFHETFFLLSILWKI